MHSVILEIIKRFDIGWVSCLMHLYRGIVFQEWGNKGLLDMHEESTCGQGKIDCGCYYRKNS